MFNTQQLKEASEILTRMLASGEPRATATATFILELAKTAAQLRKSWDEQAHEVHQLRQEIQQLKSSVAGLPR